MPSNKILNTSWFLCADCCQGDSEAYLTFVEDLASLPLIWHDWGFSDYFWYLDTCPQCHRSFSTVRLGSQLEMARLGEVLEMFAMQEGEGLASTTLKKIRNNLVSEDLGQGRRSAAIWDVGIWIAAAVGSGVIGNLAYETIKKSVLTAHRRILKSRIQNQTTLTNQPKSKPMSVAKAFEALNNARQEILSQGKFLHEGSMALQQDPELVSVCSALDNLMEKKIQRWENISDSELADLVASLYERARVRLDDLRHKNIQKEIGT